MNLRDIETPAVLIDLDKVETNLTHAADHFAGIGMAVRPHIKTHKLPEMAKRQMGLGAVGITCQKIGEAETMSDAGLRDIFLPYNILGEAKLNRLATLNRRSRLSVTADSPETILGYAAAFGPDHPLTVLIECDTGAGRCGVQTPEATVPLARAINAASGLTFGGLMTYPPQFDTDATETWLSRARTLLTAAGLRPRVISSGGTPDLTRIAASSVITEYRPGTYIYSDRMQVTWGHGTLDDCALTVLTTVVSRPTDTRFVLDAGSKALAADPVPPPATGHGHIVGMERAEVTTLSEEHGVCHAPNPPEIGSRVRVIPNHACVVTNLFDYVYLMRGDRIERIAEVAARGKLV